MGIIEEGEECRPPDSDEENVIAYYFELPCEPICESLAPTRAPVTETPTEAPTDAPTAALTDCYDKHGITEEDIINQIGLTSLFLKMQSRSLMAKPQMLQL